MKQSGDSCASVDALLLDYVYGELDGAPKRKVEEHLSGCVGCRTALMAMAETRHAMAGLTPEPAPEAGLESLLAYAQQVRPAAKPSRFWAWLVPAVSVAGASAAALLLVVGKTPDPAQGLAPAPAMAGLVQPERAKDAPPAPPVAVAEHGKNEQEDRLAQDQKEERQAARTLEVEAARLAAAADEPVARPVDGRTAEGKRIVEAKPAPAKKAVAKADVVASMTTGAGGGARVNAEPAVRLDDVVAVAPGSARPQGAAEEDAVGRGGVASRDDDEFATTAGLASNVDPLAGARPAQAPKPAVVAPAAPPPMQTQTGVPSAELEREGSAERRAEARPKAKSAAQSAPTPESLLETAARLAASGDYASAEAAYAAFLARFPLHGRAPEAALARVDVLDRLGRAQEAAAARAELARRWPDSAQAKVVRGGAGPHSAPAEPARLRAAPLEKKAAESADHAPAAH